MANSNQDLQGPFESINNALEKYYNRLNCNYKENANNGVFLQYCMDEELIDNDLDIQEELGDECDPNDCAYTWLHNQYDFPVPSHLTIPDGRMEEYIFHILQFCHKYNDSPSDLYIQQEIMPKLNDWVKVDAKDTQSVTIIPNKDLSNLSSTSLNTEIIRFEQEGKVEDEIKDENNEYEMEICVKTPRKRIEIISKHKFEPKFPARAHLNIFATKEIITDLNERVNEHFENDLDLYYYVDITSALQMNDRQIDVFKILDEEDHDQVTIAIANYDLHSKINNEDLYGIIVPNDDILKPCNNNPTKWEWKFQSFLTSDEIFDNFGITSDNLPTSSRKTPTFLKQLEQKLVIGEVLIDNTDWFDIDQIKSAQRKSRKSSRPNIIITLSKSMWMTQCKKSFQSNNPLPLIPIVINRKSNHWIEWVKIINIQSQNISVGIAIRYDQVTNQYKIKSILLDKGDILNKFGLIGYDSKQSRKYLDQLSNFNRSITKIEWSDRINPLDQKIISLKKQIQCQQASIERLKGTITTLRSVPMAVVPTGPEVTLSDSIKSFVSDNCTSIESDNKIQDEDWLDAVVNEVVKEYKVTPFMTDIIGAKRNIYVDKPFIKAWINRVNHKFTNEAEMYYWLDYTISMQMLQQYAKKYINNEDNTFMVAIFNTELSNKQNEGLYGIVGLNEKSYLRNDNKYPLKLASLMTADEIKKEFGINAYDLPKPSRKHGDFTGALILPRQINEKDLKQINWANVNLYRSASESNGGEIVSISSVVMTDYVKIAMERINMARGDNGPIENHKLNLLPIIVIDKHHNYYGIQWVLMVNLIHRNSYIGVSFEYNKNYDLFMAKGIYLCKQEIASKHILIGLSHDFSQYLPSFSIRRFKFKATPQNSVNCNTQIIQYRQQFEQERRRNDELQQQMQRQREIYTQQIQQLMRRGQVNQNGNNVDQNPNCNDMTNPNGRQQ
mmetsp:Transcript_52717/g.47359  ORF Transcript_52717/g.47359 Transcript_52717/m.47359 type:complete len:951 (-) Transcript_52717:165-3017(-)